MMRYRQCFAPDLNAEDRVDERNQTHRTTSIAPTFTASRSPSVVPRVIASITLAYERVGEVAAALASTKGIITRDHDRADHDQTEAIRMCPSAPR
jgi:hypothetical protein